MLRVSLLGNFYLSYNETLVTDVNTARLQALLAYLILHRDAPQPRAHLAFMFWPDTNEAQARTNLRNLLHHLRRVLPNSDIYLAVGGQTIQWRQDSPFDVDVVNYENALALAEQAHKTKDVASERKALEYAVGLYQGDLLPSCYDDWIIPQREGLFQTYLTALERLGWLLEELRDYQTAITQAQLLLRYDPLRESTYRNLMRLHALNGDRAGALRVYHTCTTVLQRELEVEPSAATREAYDQLMGLEESLSLTVPIQTATTPLVGREMEWTQILHAWRTAASGGGPHIIVLRGEAGIGKSRLVEDLLQWATRQGISNANTRCYAAEGDLAYAPVTAWLRAHPLVSIEDIWLAEVARLVPEVLAQRPDLPKPAPLTDVWQRGHLFEALARAILGTVQPLLLSIDDLQWCDRDSLEWLHYLLRFDRKARLLVVGAFRPEEVGANHPLTTSLQALRITEQATIIDLQPLDEVSTRTLASQVAGVEISLESGHVLYQETEGNPLFVVETVRANLPIEQTQVNVGLLKTPHQKSLSREINLPPKVMSVLEARLSQVSPPSRELVGLAATIGREFSFKLLAKASGAGENILVQQLDELWQRRIIREHGTDAYDFSHDKLREVAYLSMSSARRRLLHYHVAQALETLHNNELNLVSHQVAAHYEHADLPDNAIPFYLRAARVARQVYANEEAIELLRHGIALVGQDDLTNGEGESKAEFTAQLWEELGDILELRAQHDEALQAYQIALGRVRATDPIWKARLQCKESVVLREKRLYPDALDACRRAEIVLMQYVDKGNDSWWDEWLEVQVERVWAHYWLAEWPEMEELVNKLKPVVQTRGKGYSRMRFLMASSLMHLRRERYTVSEEMLTDTHEAYAASLEWGSLKNRAECQFEVGFLHLWRHELAQAEESLLTALKQAQTYGIVPMQTLCLTYLTVLYRFRVRLDEVSKFAQRALEVAEAAHMPDYMAAAKGNQAWIAWRRQDLSTAEEKSQEALAIWHQSPLVYPFQWQALWPLIAVCMEDDREGDAWANAQALLEPTQQLLPGDLNSTLMIAIQAKAKRMDAEARIHLKRGIKLAAEGGYL